MTDAYTKFLEAKAATAPVVGLDHDVNVHPSLWPWQADVVRWALRIGRAALFEDTGLGKTVQQLEWARHVVAATGAPVLVLAPLAVAHQTAAEGRRIGLDVKVCRTADDVTSGVNVTNYDRLHLLDATVFGGVVLDESSILKSFAGKTKRMLVDLFAATRFKLACTATPAPNDHMELGNHAEFLGIMESQEMLARWFINDTMKAGGYRLKGHAEADFWRWVASWAVCIAKPSDLRDATGRPYSDDGYILPSLHVEEHRVEVAHVPTPEDGLFRHATLNATTLHKEMRRTADDRAGCVARLVAEDPGERWVLWCNTNYEADAIRAVMPDVVEVRGDESADEKERKLDEFTDGKIRVLLTKPSIAGFGLNWQHCARTAFVGLSYSYEQLYQALRRFYRFGQTREVYAHIVVAETEVGVLQTVMDKQEAHQTMQAKMAAAMRENGIQSEARALHTGGGSGEVATGDGWTLHLGDCVEVARSLESDSIGFSVFSPPFSNLYIYTPDPRDMGNTTDDAEFFAHFEFLIGELLRITIPGRLCAVHCKDLPLYQGRDGAAGLRDFPGQIIRAFEAKGWVFHSRVTIWKDPVIEAQRTNNHGLLYGQLCKDSSASRQGMADYVVVFRKWTEDADRPAPVTRDRGPRFDHYIGTNPPGRSEVFDPRTGNVDPRQYAIQVWQRYASPVWWDIDQTDVLNYELARDGQDERHICPLQIPVIERCIELWSNPGDVVFSPFTGIGSEGYVALRMGRQFVGAELKRSYWNLAQRHLAGAGTRQLDLFATSTGPRRVLPTGRKS